MNDDGEWRSSWVADKAAPKNWSLAIGPVFRGEVYFDGRFWQATLNGPASGGYPTEDAAKARVDWKIWNRVRQMREPFKAVLARRATWENGAS